MTDLDSTVVAGLNNRGQIVGTSHTGHDLVGGPPVAREVSAASPIQQDPAPAWFGRGFHRGGACLAQEPHIDRISVQYTDLTARPGGWVPSPTAISNSGVIIGVVVPFQAFGYVQQGDESTLIIAPGTLGPGAYATLPRALNDTGTIVGDFMSGDGSGEHGFVYKNGVLSVLDVPGADYFAATGINSGGTIVGNYGYYTSGSGVPGPVAGAGILSPDGTFTRLDVPLYARAEAINDIGEILVGNSIREPDGQLRELNLPGRALAINNHGDVVATSDYLGEVHGFIYHDGQSYQIDAPNAVSTRVTGINDADQIVGTYIDANRDLHPFIAQVNFLSLQLSPGPTFATWYTHDGPKPGNDARIDSLDHHKTDSIRQLAADAGRPFEQPVMWQGREDAMLSDRFSADSYCGAAGIWPGTRTEGTSLYSSDSARLSNPPG